jgi:cytochrome c oxidase subunit 4
MSTDLATAPAGVAHDDDHHAHPTDRMFVRTAIILALITAVEVAWSYLPWPEEGRAWYLAEVGGLLFMMSIKFVMVAGTFMHLKFDKKLLTFVFYGGLLLAVAVYVAALATFAFFTTGEPPMVN